MYSQCTTKMKKTRAAVSGLDKQIQEAIDADVLEMIDELCHRIRKYPCSIDGCLQHALDHQDEAELWITRALEQTRMLLVAIDQRVYLLQALIDERDTQKDEKIDERDIGNIRESRNENA